MTPDMVAFAVRSLVRLGATARASYQQAARDAAVPVADLTLPRIERDADLRQFFEMEDIERMQRAETARLAPGGDLAALWVRVGAAFRPRDNAARQSLEAERLRIMNEQPVPAGQDWISQDLTHQGAGFVMVAQWEKGTAPATPARRLVLAFADVALDYVGANPAILGVGGNGEKLIEALSRNFRELLPNVDEENGWAGQEGKYFFAERALAITLHAGLKTLGENAGLVVQQEQYRTLLRNVLQPLLQRLDEDPGSLPDMIGLRDTLLGPMAEAALGTLAENQQAFLGKGFAADTAVGAVTAALLGEASGGPLRTLFEPAGLARLYKAALGVAVSNPRMFVNGDGPDIALAREMLVRIGKVLETAPPGLTEGLASELAVTALETLRSQVPALLRSDENAWKGAAADMIGQVLAGLSDGLAAGGARQAFERMFNKEEALALIAVFMRHAAKTPGMIAGTAADKEVQALVAAFASAASRQGAALMSAEGWIAVADEIAFEVARNPARLIKPGNGPEQQLLTRLLATVVAAAAALPADRKAAGLLFGETLRKAIVITVQAAAGRSAKAAAHLDDLRGFLALLNTVAAEEPGAIGATEWLALFDRFAGRVLDKGLAQTGLTREALLQELEA